MSQISSPMQIEDMTTNNSENTTHSPHTNTSRNTTPEQETLTHKTNTRGDHEIHKPLGYQTE